MNEERKPLLSPWHRLVAQARLNSLRPLRDMTARDIQEAREKDQDIERAYRDRFDYWYGERGNE